MIRRRNRNGVDSLALYRRRNYNFVVNPLAADDPNEPRVHFVVHLFQCPCNDLDYFNWESPLLGAEHGEKCENPACRDQPPILPYQTVTGKTPCQVEDKRVFGSFKCHVITCGRTWYSAHSWKDSSQECEDCLIKIYPYAQDNLARGMKDPKKNHVVGLCSKCRQLGKDCSKIAEVRGGRRQRRRRVQRNDPLANIANGLQQLVI